MAETGLKERFLAVAHSVGDAFKRFGKYMADRFKRFAPMRYVGLVCLLALFICFLLFDIMWTDDMASGLPFFTDGDGNELTGYEIGSLIAFYIVTVFLLGTFIYDLFFQEIPPRHGKITKDIVKGRVIDIEVPENEREKGPAEEPEEAREVDITNVLNTGEPTSDSPETKEDAATEETAFDMDENTDSGAAGSEPSEDQQGRDD